jgi:hypothetical protein
LCKKHLDEHYEKEKRRDEAVRFLHTGMLDDQTIQNAELKDEVRRLKVWWSRACDAIICQVENTILKDEAEYAITWCVNLAIVIIKEEKAYRGGDQSPPPWNPLREQLWERFKNLEAGLRSNGVPRPKAKQNPQR